MSQLLQRPLIVCLSSVVVSLLNLPALTAQEQGGLEIASATGVLSAMAGNQIKITTESKEEYFVVLSKDSTLRYQGSADKKFLMPGLFVRFSTVLNQNGIAQTPLSNIEVFTPSSNRHLNPDQLREQTPGVYQEGGEVGKVQPKAAPVKPAAKDPAATKPARTPRGAGAIGDVGSFRVVGQLAGGQGNKLMVMAGTMRLQIELADDAKIGVSGTDLMFCQQGDTVKVSGLRVAGQEKWIQAESVQITGSKPLGPEEGKAAKGSRNKGKKDPVAEADDKAKPLAGEKGKPQAAEKGKPPVVEKGKPQAAEKAN